MFVLVVCGGPNDGERIDRDGWVSHGAVPPAKFDDLSEAMEAVEHIKSNGFLARGDFGPGVTDLAIDELV